MGLKSKENAEELRMRYIPGYLNKQSGSVEYLNPTERSKIATNIAMKLMGCLTCRDSGNIRGMAF